ncbi:MAG: hypothetical protein B1H04_02180 [Planctomycetales bacterium 4484_123]|nr:MAG: hypothetical protein B1H04_02180 [Planctomycetales bacterium 4484_123]
MDDSQLRHVWRNGQRHDGVSSLSEPLTRLVQYRLARRVRQLGQLAAAWDECIPQYIREHTALVSYARGTLTVAVDSAAHRYRLQRLLQDGLEQAIRERLPSALRRIRLVPGSFDAVEFPAQGGSER